MVLVIIELGLSAQRAEFIPITPQDHVYLMARQHDLYIHAYPY